MNTKKYLIPLLILMGWLIPGSSFWVLGKRTKAILIFGLLLVLLIVGLLCSDYRYVRFDDHPFYYLGKFGSGIVWLVTKYFTSPKPRGVGSLKYAEAGLLYICVAGALNVVTLLSISSIAMKRPESKVFDLITDGT